MCGRIHRCTRTQTVRCWGTPFRDMIPIEIIRVVCGAVGLLFLFLLCVAVRPGDSAGEAAQTLRNVLLSDTYRYVMDMYTHGSTAAWIPRLQACGLLPNRVPEPDQTTQIRMHLHNALVCGCAVGETTRHEYQHCT